MNYLNQLALIQTHGDICTDTGSPAGSAPSFVALWLRARQLRGPRPTFQNPAVDRKAQNSTVAHRVLHTALARGFSIHHRGSREISKKRQEELGVSLLQLSGKF